MRDIQPLGEQIIIKTLPVDSIGSILIPDSAKRITLSDPDKPTNAVHYVEAEVIAVGPGKKSNDRTLLKELAYCLEHPEPLEPLALAALLHRARNPGTPLTPAVKPGDRILYHPAVQRFDRDVTDLMSNGDANSNGAKWFIIREESILAVIEPEDKD